MKKLFTLFAAASMAATVSAQTVTESKTFDNFYVGINGGLTTNTTGVRWMHNLNPNAGLRIGRYFTPVFGVALDGNAYFSNKPGESTGTFVRFINASALATVNFSNWFGGYKGEPRAFEIIGLYGFGWERTFNNKGFDNANYLTSKVALDFAFNFGSKKQFQAYIEPAIYYALNGVGYSGLKYNLDESRVQLNAGLVYRFGNSNGTHNFQIAQVRDQAEIDGLNAQINNLRNDLNGKDSRLAEKDRQIADLQKALDDCNNQPKTIVKKVKMETVTNLQPTVLFRQGKSVIDPAQYAPLELIASYMRNHPESKVEIRGYASPEGSPELNQKLSDARAQAVKDALVKKYKIAASRLTTKGMGVTDTLFEEVSFNRVATFNDNAKGE